MLATSKREKTKGIIALIFLALIFASMGVFVRFLNVDFTILRQTYLRVGIAALLAIVVFARDVDIRKLQRISYTDWGLLFVRAMSLYLLAVTLVSYAYTIGKYSSVSFLQAIPFTAILGFVLLKEKVTGKKILYILLAFIGVVLVSVKDYSNLLAWGNAELFSIAAGFFFALSYVLRRWQSDLLNNKEIAVMIFLIATALLIGTSFLFGEGMPSSSWNIFTLFILFGAGLFNVLNLFLTNYGFQKVEAVIASNILTLETVFAVLLGFMFFQEIPTIIELLGGIIIVIGVYQMNKLA